MDPLTEAANAHLAALAQQAEAEALANQNAENSTNQNAENETSEANGEENDDKPKVDNEIVEIRVNFDIFGTPLELFLIKAQI